MQWINDKKAGIARINDKEARMARMAKEGCWKDDSRRRRKEGRRE